jgi:flotillin
MFLVTVFGLFMAISKNWIKVSPNEAAIVSGRQYKTADGQRKRGYKIVTGGGFIKFPVLDKVEFMKLNVMSFPVEVKNVPDVNGALVTVIGIANVKVSSDPASIELAVERFLSMTRQEIEAVAKENLESNLRAIVGTLTIDSLIKDRQSLQQAVLDEAVGDLKKMGLGVDLLNVQDVRDERGYIESLGKKRTAEVVRDATIGEAEAKAEADVKSAEARQRGEIAQALADQKISDANKERDVVIAQNEADIAAKRARIPIRAEIASADERKGLEIAQVEADKARVEAGVELQIAERKRKEAELNASTIVQAEKQKEATIIAADAEQEAATRKGEAYRIKESKEGEGDRNKRTAIAEGRKAEAEAHQKELEAEAAGQRAKLLAEAEGEKAKLLAEAEGALEKAKAFKELDEAGRFLMILDASPLAIRAIGEAISHFMKPTADAIGQGLANVEEIRLIDMGNGNGNGHSVLSQFVNTPVESIFGLLQKMDAAQLMPLARAAFSQAGIDLDGLLASGEGGNGEATPPPKKSTKGDRAQV